MSATSSVGWVATIPTITSRCNLSWTQSRLSVTTLAPSGYPVVDYSRALHVLTHGAPLSAAYTCTRADVIRRNMYDNHSDASKAAASVLKKIVGGCNNHFLLVLPRWIYRFIYGLFLSSIGFVERKDKGRLVVDPSTYISDAGDTGALNDFISKKDPVQ